MSAADSDDVAQLSDQERAALETYMAVTSQDVEQAIPLLRRSQWNVQVSRERITLLQLRVLLRSEAIAT